MLTKLKKLVIHRKVFIPALLFGLVLGGIESFRIYYFFFIIVHARELFMSTLGVVRGALLSIIMFVIFYRLGKNIDLRNSYVSVSASLIIGSTLGPLFGWLAGVIILKLISPVAAEYWWDSWGDQLRRAALLATFHIPRQLFLGFTALSLAYLRNRERLAEGVRMTKRSRLKCQVIGFCTGALVAMGFTVLGLKIDIKIISIYDHLPWSISFMLILLIVGLLVGWKVETITTRELIRRNVEGLR